MNYNNFKTIFGTWGDFKGLSIKYNLEDCGMSGRFPKFHWFQDDDAQVTVYIK